MLAEWLEKEAQGEMVKTAAQQFEEELSALDVTSIAQVWREAKQKEAQVGQRLMQAVPGAIGGGMLGAGLGAAGGAIAAPTGQRWDAAQQGALVGGALGAGGGALRAAAMNPARMQAANTARQGFIREMTGVQPGMGAPQVGQALETLTSPMSAAETAGSLAGTAGTLGSAVAGVREGVKKRKKEKEKKSSVDFMRLALMKKAVSGEEEARLVQQHMQKAKAQGRKLSPSFESGAKKWIGERAEKKVLRQPGMHMRKAIQSVKKLKIR